MHKIMLKLKKLDYNDGDVNVAKMIKKLFISKLLLLVPLTIELNRCDFYVNVFKHFHQVLLISIFTVILYGLILLALHIRYTALKRGYK